MNGPWAWPIAIASCLVAHQAAAQSDQALGTRQELIARALEASKAGDHAAALSLAKRAAILRMTPSLRMFIAQEQKEVGLLAGSYGNARQCAAEAEADLSLDDRARILARCRALEEALVRRIAHVVVTLPSPAPAGAHVRVAGEDIDLALLGTPLVVTPGKVPIAVVAPGYVPYETEVTLGEAAEAEVTVRLERAAPAPTTAAPVPGVTPVTAPDSRVLQPPRLRPPERSGWGLPAAVAGSGFVAAGLGTVVWLAGNDRYQQIRSQCTGPGGCSPAAYDSAVSAVHRDDAIGVTGWIVGAALIAAGGLWYVLAAPGSGASVGQAAWPATLGGTF